MQYIKWCCDSATKYFRYKAKCFLIMPKGLSLVDLKRQVNGGGGLDELPENKKEMNSVYKMVV